MDEDSSTKFIGSLTKFLQSLCNGYVEFQRGVELVGHIYLSIDTGEKVDYILHEKVSKNDENSVTFVSNSFHAQPLDKGKDKTAANKDAPSKSGSASTRGSRGTSSGGDDDDDIMIVDNSGGAPGSTNSGTIPSRGMKRVASPSSDQRQSQRAVQHGAGGSSHRNQGSSNPMSSPPRNRQQSGGPSATVTSQDTQQENINMGDMKLEQISTDELLSLASQVGAGEGASSSNASSMQGQRGGPVRVGRSSLGESAGQPVWIKQEAPDDMHGGPDTGWSHSRDGQSDSSNSGSNLYPVMMHPNPAFTSNPIFPGFPSMSGPAATSTSQHHSLPQSLPGTSGNPYTNPMPGMSGGIDPAVFKKMVPCMSSSGLGNTRSRHLQITPKERHRLYRERLKQDPVRYRQYLARQLMYTKRYQARKKMENLAKSSGVPIVAFAVSYETGGVEASRRDEPHTRERLSSAEIMRQYRQRIKHDPERYHHYKLKQKERYRRYRERLIQKVRFRFKRKRKKERYRE